MQRQINSVMKQQPRQSRDITQSLKNGHQSLHTEIQRVHTQVTHLSDAVEENREKITNIAEDQCRTAEKLQKLESEIERLESFSRRNNLRFFNIPQSTNETDDDCTRTLVRTLNHFYPSKRWNEDDIEGPTVLAPLHQTADDHARLSPSFLAGETRCWCSETERQGDEWGTETCK